MSRLLLARSDWRTFLSLLLFTHLTPALYARGAFSVAIFTDAICD